MSVTLWAMGGDRGRKKRRTDASKARSTDTPSAAPPDCFLCPITREMLRDPVITADGHTYEREAIEKHLSEIDALVEAV